MDLLLVDPAKARQQLGWQPEVSFEQLVTMMVDQDVATLSLGLAHPRMRAAA